MFSDYKSPPHSWLLGGHVQLSAAQFTKGFFTQSTMILSQLKVRQQLIQIKRDVTIWNNSEIMYINLNMKNLGRRLLKKKKQTLGIKAPSIILFCEGIRTHRV